MESKRHLLVIGARGALGKELVQHFKARNVWVASVDHGENDVADVSINISATDYPTTLSQAEWIENRVKQALKIDDAKGVLDGIFAVAGGWTGSNVSSQEFLKSVDSMWKQSVESSAVAAYLAGKLLKEGGMLVMTGAQAALNATPTMIGYGMAKAAVHHLIKSLAAEGSGLPKNSVVVGLLPRILDTPNNRKFADNSTDFSTWTPLSDISRLTENWLDSSETSVKTGSLIEVVTKEGITTTQIH